MCMVEELTHVYVVFDTQRNSNIRRLAFLHAVKWMINSPI
jgi:hypothetical protein